ncbi:MAG TPA: asparagine synthase (glutamine-hydrolyzing) [Magnetospirillum sp.]|nr:asparagine synthase (glutamine-hydrolyzing) [Magnetospirillum sp.]
MCGLLALASWSGPVDPVRADVALARMRHRGPDGEGVLARWNGRLMLGHRRLAIFDPGPNGDQPMLCPDSGDSLVFNGAIYNYPELREELARLGHRFRTDTDTEVILKAWRQWGTDAFRRFNGMWALALHDAASDRLVLCRDRLGVKPLYMLRSATSLAVASEVRAVVAAAGIRPEVDADVAFDFLLLGLGDHRGTTMVRGVVAVEPGTVWMVEPDGTARSQPYHSWPAVEPSLTTEDAAAILPELLCDATRLRLRSHVPVAAHLSGGLDSGGVAWAIGRRREEVADRFVGFFSYGYHPEAGQYDEIQAARATRDHVAADLPFVEVRAPHVPTLAEIEDLVSVMELPVSTPSTLAGRRLYGAIRQGGAIVALTGDGDDELFAGYTRRYVPVALRDALRRGDAQAVRALAASPHLVRGAAVARLAWELPVPLMHRMMRRRRHVSVLTSEYWHASADRFRDMADLQRHSLDPLGRVDVLRLLLPQILRHSDRNAMASSVEARAPFLDHRIAELSMRLPMAAKVGAAGGKQPVRRALRGHLPAAVTEGGKVRGLGHAEQFMVGRMELGSLLHDTPAARPYLDLGRLDAALKQAPGDSRLWWPVCFLVWLRQLGGDRW